jgi:hypothetical protein
LELNYVKPVDGKQLVTNSIRVNREKRKGILTDLSLIFSLSVDREGDKRQDR